MGRVGRPEPELITDPQARARYLSPLRYPGAKSLMTKAISTLVKNARSTAAGPVRLFVEPFAGGASTALRLVSEGAVDQILLADSDPLVACFWQAAAVDTEELVARAHHEWEAYVHPGGAAAVDRWDHWRGWLPDPGASVAEVRLGLAVKCLFLNRTTFSGILHGRAGPIGGRAQTSDYPIGCRWNPSAIEDRIKYIGHLYERGRLVDVWLKDWVDTVDDLAERLPDLPPESTLLYLDPPYLAKSDRLYRQAADRDGSPTSQRMDAAPTRDLTLHLKLADYLTREAQHRWILSYDANDDLLASNLLYRLDRMAPRKSERDYAGVRRWRISKRLVSQLYSASAASGRGLRDELLITTLPPSAVPLDATFRPVRRDTVLGLVQQADP
jgi:DNA adenine methylase